MKILFAIFFLPAILISQTLQFVNDFGNFENASSFDIDLSNNIFVADAKLNTISKFDSTGKLLNSIGGFGWDQSTFDEPIDIVTNTLSLYVADKNNNRIQRFDKDLNFLSEYSGTDSQSEVQFGYPICVEISNIGDLFILDSDNNKILKFNLNGEFLQEIGGNDAGNFAINNPKSFAIDNSNNLFVLDEQTIKVFDQYGNDLFYFKLDFFADKIKFDFDNLVLINKNKFSILNISDRKIIFDFTSFPHLDEENIIDAKIIGNYLLLLSQHRIIKYFIIK
ncbi:MAG: NHL repeat-containing protein [Ignavibacteriae bacterium]|nr:NHL repeat-containing protein [Ignavibacteriota bacterium]